MAQESESILLALISEEKKHEVTKEVEMVVQDLGVGRPWYQVVVSGFGSKEVKVSPLVYSAFDAQDEWERATGHKCPFTAEWILRMGREAVGA